MKNESTDNSPSGYADHQIGNDKLLVNYYAIRERLWIVFLCVVLGGIGAAIKVATMEPKFQARSVLFLEQEQNKVLSNVKEVREEQVGSLDMINTVVDLLGSYTFAERVSKRVEWDKDPKNTIAKPDIPDAGQISQMVAARYRKGTRLIDIFVTNTNPQVATILANAYANEYVRYVFEKRSEASKNARSYLIEESERLSEKMRVSEEKIQSIRVSENSPSPEKQQAVLEAKVQQASAQLDQLDAVRFQLDSDLTVARANVGKVDELLRLTSVAREPKIAQLNQSIADQERQMLLLAQRYRSEHPTYIANQTQLDSLIKDRNATLENVVSLLESGRLHLQAQIDEVTKEKKENEAELLKVIGKSVEYNDRKRALDTDRTMYDSVLGRMKEIDMTAGFTSSPVTIQEKALGALSLNETRLKTYLTNLLLGLGAGIAIALGLNALDTSIKTVENAETITGLSVLAAIPLQKKKKTNKKRKTNFDTIDDRRGLIAEGFRSLRASLAFLSIDQVKRTFMITSAVPSEGKTFCSSNFAIILSQQDLKTLLIDADLRKPTVSKVFFQKSVSPGLSDVLANLTTLQEAIVPTEIENLSILTAGNNAPNPAELLGTSRFKDLLTEALLTYDRVVVDTAPCLAVSDAQLIAPLFDVRCLVVRTLSTSKKTVLSAIKSLDDIHCLPNGLILNFMPDRNSSYHYSGRYVGPYNGKDVYGAEVS